MAECDSPFLVRLVGTATDDTTLYMMMEVVMGGELFSYLQVGLVRLAGLMGLVGVFCVCVPEALCARQFSYPPGMPRLPLKFASSPAVCPAVVPLLAAYLPLSQPWAAAAWRGPMRVAFALSLCVHACGEWAWAPRRPPCRLHASQACMRHYAIFALA